MTADDKQIIANYMGWLTHPKGDWYDTPVYFAPGIVGDVKFDLNDAGLVVAEMQKRGEWDDFVTFVEETPENRELCYTWSQFIAWLFNANNFFKAFVEWRKLSE